MTRSQQWQTVAFGLGAVLLLWLAGRYGARTGFAVLVGLVFAPYWLGPAMVWLTNLSRVPSWHEKAPAGVEGVPLEVRPFFRATGSDLDDCGFAMVALLTENLVPGFGTWVSLHVNRALHERAVVVAHFPANPPSAIKPTPALYFRTKFTDGRVLETGNIHETSVFPALDGYEPWQFPEIADAKLLYRLHELRLAPLGSAPRERIPEGAEVAHLTGGMADYYMAQVGKGYLRVAEPGRSFRPTVKGALLMTWKLLPPMSWLARARVRRRNRDFLAAHNVIV